MAFDLFRLGPEIERKMEMADKKKTGILTYMAVGAAGLLAIKGMNEVKSAKQRTVYGLSSHVRYADPFIIPKATGMLGYHDVPPVYDLAPLRESLESLLESHSRREDDFWIETLDIGAIKILAEIGCLNRGRMEELMKSRDEFEYILGTDDFTMRRDGRRVIIDIPLLGYSVLIGDLLKEREYLAGDGVTLAVGMDPAGKCFYEDIEDMPHLLISGTAGSGKTMLMHGLMLSVLMKHGPKDVEIFMIDPKGTEFRPYRCLGYCRIANEPCEAGIMLWEQCREMDRRLRILSDASAADIGTYNERHPENRMKRRIIFIDELADLMLSGFRNSIEDSLARLAAKGGACGIHLVMATSQPGADVATGRIMANIPARAALNTTSESDSRFMLGHAGAERLQMHGDMLYMNGGEPVRLQAGLVSRDEIMCVLDALIKNQTILPDLAKARKKTGRHKACKAAGIFVAVIAIMILLGKLFHIQDIRELKEATFYSEEAIEEYFDMGYNKDEIIQMYQYDLREIELEKESGQDARKEDAEYEHRRREIVENANAEIEARYAQYEAASEAYERECWRAYEESQEAMIRRLQEGHAALEADNDGRALPVIQSGMYYEPQTEGESFSGPVEVSAYNQTVEAISPEADGFDEYRVGSQYKGDVYYNTDSRGSRMDGFDEFYYVNEH